MTPADYQTQRQLRGTQESVAAQLGVHAQTIAKRERGAPDAPITREAELALLSLPKKRKRKAGPSNNQVTGAGAKPQPRPADAQTMRTCCQDRAEIPSPAAGGSGHSFANQTMKTPMLPKMTIPERKLWAASHRLPENCLLIYEDEMKAIQKNAITQSIELNAWRAMAARYYNVGTPHEMAQRMDVYRAKVEEMQAQIHELTKDNFEQTGNPAE